VPFGVCAEIGIGRVTRCRARWAYGGEGVGAFSLDTQGVPQAWSINVSRLHRHQMKASHREFQRQTSLLLHGDTEVDQEASHIG
jgi:hypothetical protein